MLLDGGFIAFLLASASIAVILPTGIKIADEFTDEVKDDALSDGSVQLGYTSLLKDLIGNHVETDENDGGHASSRLMSSTDAVALRGGTGNEFVLNSGNNQYECSDEVDQNQNFVVLDHDIILSRAVDVTGDHDVSKLEEHDVILRDVGTQLFLDEAEEDLSFSVSFGARETNGPSPDDADDIFLDPGLDVVFLGQNDTVTFLDGDGIIALGDYGAGTDTDKSPLLRSIFERSNIAYFYADTDNGAAPKVSLNFQPDQNLTAILADGVEVGRIEDGNWEDRVLSITPIPYDPALVAASSFEVIESLLNTEFGFAHDRRVVA